MASIPLESLPSQVRTACERLRDRLGRLLGDELVALWVHGAVTFPDRPNRLGDIDTHGFLVNRPDHEVAADIQQIHDSIGAELGIEWDSWYVVKADAIGSAHPRNALHGNLVDHAWALHRAHWLRGQYVALGGCTPPELVRLPSWEELQDGLRNELRYIERHFSLRRDNPTFAAYAVCNCCRILCSVTTRDVVISKNASAQWALIHMPDSWHSAIRAAGRIYDGKPEQSDVAILNASVIRFLAEVREKIVSG